jgi:hypothetical protein
MKWQGLALVWHFSLLYQHHAWTVKGRIHELRSHLSFIRLNLYEGLLEPKVMVHNRDETIIGI